MAGDASATPLASGMIRYYADMECYRRQVQGSRRLIELFTVFCCA